MATDAVSRYAVSTQVTVFCEVSRSRLSVGMSGATIDCSSENVPSATTSTATVTRSSVLVAVGMFFAFDICSIVAKSFD